MKAYRLLWRTVVGLLVLWAALLQPAYAQGAGNASILGRVVTVAGPATEPTPGPEDIHLSGRVYDALGGPAQGIEGATVSVCTSVPRCFPATTGPDGTYTLLVPVPYADLVNEVRVWATGYQSLSQAVTAAELRAEPIRDFPLTRLPRIWLPVVLWRPGP
jgi:hypothetical protein